MLLILRLLASDDIFANHRWPIDSRAELDNVPFEIHTIALYSNGTHGDVRLQVLRELCRERGWTVTGGFSDESIAVSRLGLEEFCKHQHAVRPDACIVWSRAAFSVLKNIWPEGSPGVEA